MENLFIILTILFIHLLAVVSPGPDFVVAVRNSVNFGRRAGIFTAIGFGLGICIHLFYCYFGVAVLISQTPQLFAVIKILGAIYLFYIAYQIFMHRNSFSSSTVVTENNQGNQNSTIKLTDIEAVKSGFLTNALNPKATLFFLGLFSTAITVDISTYSLLIICFFLAFNTFLWFSIVAFLFTQKNTMKVFEKYAVYINISLSVFLGLLSIKIVFF